MTNSKNVAVLGSGKVGGVLANGLLANGYAVMRASREPAKLDAWKQTAGAGASTGTFADAAKWANIVVLAVKGGAAESVIELAGPANLAGKTVIDATNPIADAPPTNGVLKYFSSLDDSHMERLQREFKNARFVKAFNSVGAPSMVNPQFKGGPPTMFICGNDDGAKKSVTRILDQFGWETADMGKAEAARAIEPLCMLWCIPGFLRQDWVHAFKLLR